MEILKRFAYRAFETARSVPLRRCLARWVIPAAAAMLLAYGAPFEELIFSGTEAAALPLAALAFACAAWCAWGSRAFLVSLLGLAAGCAAAETYSGCVSAVLLLAFGIAVNLVKGRVSPLMKHASLLGACVLCLPFSALLGLHALTLSGAAEQVCVGALCTVLSILLRLGLKGAAVSGRYAEASLVSSALLGGLISAAFGYSRVLGLSPGMAAAALFCLAASRHCGLNAIACAALIAAVRVLALNGDMLFIAVLCLCTLCASALGWLGKWGVLAGFAVPALALYHLIPGTGTLPPAELLLGALVFTVSDLRPFFAAGSAARSARERELENRLIALNGRLIMLSKVLDEIAKLFSGGGYGTTNGFINRQLCGIAETLRGLASAASEEGRNRRLDISVGSAESPGRGSAQTGDAACVRELRGMCLAAISDGMGTGSQARRESEQTVNMVADLVACGFNIDRAADCVNRLLLMNGCSESYATLDAMLFDLSKGCAVAAKHGAPSSFILRKGKLNELSAEALPVGILEEAESAVFSVKLMRGDMIFMMSDGVSDALGEELYEVLKQTARQRDPDSAARVLIEQAERMGGEDDMTAIVAMVG